MFSCDYGRMYEYVEEALVYIVNYEKKHKDEPTRGYLNSQYDSNLSRFERLSNMGTIGVLAKNKKHGKFLLQLLHSCVDKNDIVEQIVLNQDEDPKLDPENYEGERTEFCEKFIELIGSWVDCTEHAEGELISYELQNGREIRRPFDQVFWVKPRDLMPP